MFPIWIGPPNIIRSCFGPEVSRTKKPERVWFGAARTKLGLELVASGEKPSIHHICVRVAGFDKKSAMEKLKRAGIESIALATRDWSASAIRTGL